MEWNIYYGFILLIAIIIMIIVTYRTLVPRHKPLGYIFTAWFIIMAIYHTHSLYQAVQ